MPAFIDLTGKKFGRWTVLEKAQRIKGRLAYKCKCDCGNIKVVQWDHLRDGCTKSCGCLAKELITTHGLSKTPTYNTWVAMLQRCNNHNHPRYKDWGGRGIKVCDRWLKFESFFEDMGEKPTGLLIERIDNERGYYPSNCKWATRLQQQKNQRVNKKNKTGVSGVFLDKRDQKYLVQIKTNRQNHYVGKFDTIEQAAVARKQAEQIYWGKT